MAVKKREVNNVSHFAKYFFGFIFLAFAVLTFFVAKPLVSAILAGGVIAYMFYPIYKRVYRFIRVKGVAAFIVSLLLVIIITLPLVFLFENLTKEVNYVYLRTRQKIAAGNILGITCEEPGAICNFVNNFNSLISEPATKTYLMDAVGRVLTFVSQKASDFILSIPKILLTLIVTLLVVYYLFKDGAQLLQRLKKITPLKLKHQQELYKQIGDVIHAVLYGSIIVAAIQGTMGGLGFYLFRVDNPVFWGIIMMILALIPFVGTAFIWLPASLMYIIDGYITGADVWLLRGIGLLVYGLIVVAPIDNFLKPMIIGERARVHPLLIVIGVLGGLAMFGLIGFVIGPLIISIFKVLFEIYEKEQLPHVRD